MIALVFDTLRHAELEYRDIKKNIHRQIKDARMRPYMQLTTHTGMQILFLSKHQHETVYGFNFDLILHRECSDEVAAFYASRIRSSYVQKIPKTPWYKRLWTIIEGVWK